MSHRLIVEYTHEAQPHSDAQCWKNLTWLTDRLTHTDENIVVRTSNELMVAISRLLVARGIIRSTEVLYVYGDHRIAIDDDARIYKWPKGFCDNMEQVLEELFSIPARGTE